MFTAEEIKTLRHLAETYTGNDLTRLGMLFGLYRKKGNARRRPENDVRFRARVLHKLSRMFALCPS